MKKTKTKKVIFFCSCGQIRSPEENNWHKPFMENFSRYLNLVRKNEEVELIQSICVSCKSILA